MDQSLIKTAAQKWAIDNKKEFPLLSEAGIIAGAEWAFGQIDPLCDEAAQIIEKLQAENAKLREVVEIARRYAIVEYGESASCRVIASEIQQAFPSESNPDLTCRICGGKCKASEALSNLIGGSPEFPDGNMEGATLSAASDAVLIQCLKCEECGHSFTVGPSAGRLDIDTEYRMLSGYFYRWEMFTDGAGNKKLYYDNLTIYHDGHRWLMKDNEKLNSLNYCEINPHDSVSLRDASKTASKHHRSKNRT